MNNVLIFPKKEKQKKPLPRQRVFYLGFRYVGPMLCQEVQNIYLKRNGLKKGSRTWSLITYGKYDEYDSKNYSLELDTCEEDNLPDLLDEYDVGGEVTFDELKEMGWRGKVVCSSGIIKLYSANVISLIHKCYNNVIFPNFVKPLDTGQFNGTDIMMESRDAQGALEGKNLYSFIHYRNRYPLGHVWMNLHKLNTNEYATVPVKPREKFSNQFYKRNFVKK